jgi:hypothetical protein
MPADGDLLETHIEPSSLPPAAMSIIGNFGVSYYQQCMEE